MALVDAELSEPYSIFTYRYFLHTWPRFSFLAHDGSHCFGVIVAKLERHRDALMRGYIAMLVVEQAYRGLGAGAPPPSAALVGMCGEQAGGVLAATPSRPACRRQPRPRPPQRHRHRTPRRHGAGVDGD